MRLIRSELSLWDLSAKVNPCLCGRKALKPLISMGCESPSMCYALRFATAVEMTSVHLRQSRNRRGAPGFALSAAIITLIAAACSVGPNGHVPALQPRQAAANHNSKEKNRQAANPFVLVGAGDIAACSVLAGAEATAKLIEQIPGTVFAAGDLAYERGTTQEFRDCYGKTWGRFKDRTKPTPGNHEYNSGGAAAYFAYWGAQAGRPEKSYYSFDLGNWHVIALNTNCTAPGV